MSLPWISMSTTMITVSKLLRWGCMHEFWHAFLLSSCWLNQSFISAELTIIWAKNWWRTYQFCGSQTWCLSHYGHASIFVMFSSYFLKTLGLKVEAGETVCSFFCFVLVYALEWGNLVFWTLLWRNHMDVDRSCAVTSSTLAEESRVCWTTSSWNIYPEG
jgi:hypothetical protein